MAISKNVTVNYAVQSSGAFIPQQDGSIVFPILLVPDQLSAPPVPANLALMPDGVTWHDVKGNPIANPPPALVALATATTNYIAKNQAAIAAAGVQAILQTLI